ncbi:MAG: hypothetical protein R6V38_10405 [Roseovarius gahaiensis]
MSFMRPEAQAALRKWREALTGGVVVALGLWWVFGFVGLLHWLGYPVVLLGFALVWIGFQRARFRIGQNGPGVVQVDEGQIAYFGPLNGGVVALADITRLTVDRTGHPSHWRLSQPGQPDLVIPLTARGADRLFDAFAQLPGLRTEWMLSQMQRGDHDTIVIWQKRTNALH